MKNSGFVLYDQPKLEGTTSTPPQRIAAIPITTAGAKTRRYRRPLLRSQIIVSNSDAGKVGIRSVTTRKYNVEERLSGAVRCRKAVKFQAEINAPKSKKLTWALDLGFLKNTYPVTTNDATRPTMY
jgi:hypothetical protein